MNGLAGRHEETNLMYPMYPSLVESSEIWSMEKIQSDLELEDVPSVKNILCWIHPGNNHMA
eukprot:1099846-Karenia_brevis.AAC.1